MRRWLVLAVLAGCGDNAPAQLPTEVEVVALPVETTSKLDVLFVLDTEASTLEHQVALRAAFPALLAQLSIDGRPDLHLGAISPDLGVSDASGAVGTDIGGTAQGGCVGDGKEGELQQFNSSIHDRYLIDSADASNHPNALAQDASYILSLGSNGCGFQQHLSAARLAFTNPANVGFRRPDAALGIVVLADEDDCSVLDTEIFGPASPTLGALQHFRCTQFGVVCDQADMTSTGPRTNCRPNATSTEIEDPGDFVDAFRAQVADPRRFSFGAIIAPSRPNDVTIDLRAPSGSMSPIPELAPSCEWEETSSDGGNYIEQAEPSVRLAWLANRFGDRGSIGSICNQDITPAATTIGIGLRRAMGDPCVEDDVPLDHCTAVDELDGVEVPVPPCGVTSASCWELVTDPVTCPNAANQKLVVHRIGSAPAGTYTLLRC
jgi:hypothetical protein